MRAIGEAIANDSRNIAYPLGVRRVHVKFESKFSCGGEQSAFVFEFAIS